ncbi:unnamed protein product [Prunus armeniaca]|uniref:Uncharacterized protein n=1 Tax=Prunus armeniaca TaxID=36596 RepID=A0A6J5WHT0_PRUAR|nr:unnamed protein product [Prunus armeniaca]CAB4301230.1 unnamed protein product [Prunus armeniaca]
MKIYDQFILASISIETTITCRKLSSWLFIEQEKWQLLKIKDPECSSASASKLDGVPMDPAVLDDITTRLLEISDQ